MPRPEGGSRSGLAAAERTALQLAKAVADRLDAGGWRGFDPYDALSSPIARLLRARPLRQGLVQGVRRSPVNLRRALRIRRRHMAMTTGMAASAAARLQEDDRWARLADRLARWTAGRQIPAGGWQGLWGYEFDVQTRWSFYPAGSPNIVATVFAADGCLDGGVLGDEQVVALSENLLATFYRGTHFAYTPTSDVLIHNANLLGAALAARLGVAQQLHPQLRRRLREAAQTATMVALERQRPDGSWPYGEGPSLGWVDGFHSAYVLLRLDQVRERTGLDVGEAIERGTAYYLSHLLPHGVPQYFPGNRKGPRDVNNAATGLLAACWAAGKGLASADLAYSVLRHVITEFCDSNGRVRADARSWWPAARIEYPRWGGAPVLDALTAVVGWERERSRDAASDTSCRDVRGAG
jgi:hypothetical protein